MITVGEAVFITDNSKVGTVENIMTLIFQNGQGADWPSVAAPYTRVRYLISWNTWRGRVSKWVNADAVMRIKP
jgi:hypothetical protein